MRRTGSGPMERARASRRWPALALGTALALLLGPLGAPGDPKAAHGQADRTPGAARAPLERVAALGRLEPGRGVIRIAGPPRAAAVIERLHIEEGDFVEQGEALADLAGIGVHRAEVARLRAELANAERELERHSELRRSRVLSESDWQALQVARDVARARLAGAKAELALSTVRSPIAGQILEIHAREGERVRLQGVAEIGDTSAMYAVAEVYETDIGRVRVGQHASIRSAALSRELEGEVEHIGLKIGKQDTLSTDPVADADARVVEVRVRILEPALAAALTNARVDVVIAP